MAIPLRYGPTPRAVARRVRAHPLANVDPGFRFNAGAPPAYVRPRITGMVVGDDPIPPSRPSFGGPGGIMPPAGAPPATTPSAPTPPAVGGGGGGGPGPWNQPVPGRGGPLSWNPQLINPDTALGGYNDAQFQSDKNDALSALYPKYHAVLQRLGFMDPSGNMIEGSIESGARVGRFNDQRDLGLQATDVTNEERERGTLFSGIRGTHLAERQYQTVKDLADIDMQVPLDIGTGWGELEDIYGTYNRAINQAILEAWGRKTEAEAP